MKTSGNTILITGGGSGIGEALAQRFHDRGDTVIVAGRRRETLERAIVGRPNMHAIELDVGNPEDIATFPQRLLTSYPGVNVLLNNAGIMKFEALDRRRDLGEAQETINTNLLGPINLINALIDHLTHQADAAIVNVTSGQAFLPLFGTATYSATKAAMHSYTLSLRAMLKGQVEVIELIPPALQTSITPGQEHNPSFMPLEDFAEEVMGLFAQQPTPREILVERVKFQRFAEAEGRFDESVTKLNEMAAKAAEAARR